MNHRIKRFFFTSYMGISVLLFIGAIILFILVPGDVKVKWGALSAFEAGVLWFAFSVQKQHLEEVKLFKELFEGFNKRYDGLNEELNHIYQQPEDKPFESRERDALYKYFNLCGEEHLYADLGFIYPTVWTSWKNGMIFFRQNSRIKKLWDEDLGADTYYGLDFKEGTTSTFFKCRFGLSIARFLMLGLLCTTVNLHAQETAKGQFDPIFWGWVPVPDPKPVEEIRLRAENGDAISESELGEFYQFGVGVAVDAVEAVKWYRKAAEQDNAQAEYRLGFCYANGRGVVKDAVKAPKLYSKAADQNNAEAQFNLGTCYDSGLSMKKDVVEAAKWYRKAADQNYADAQVNLGVCYLAGSGVVKNEAEGVKWFQKAVAQGNAQAQANLGKCYNKGRGIPKDEAEGVKWFQKAAEQNLAEAQFNLCVCFANGQGVAKDEVEAVKWLRKSAEQNYVEAQQALARFEGLGEGVEAEKAYRTAIEQKLAELQQSLAALIQSQRKGVGKDNAEQQYNMGVRYALGEGVVKDEVEAVKWYRKAARQGLAQARCVLGYCYFNGSGVPRNVNEAVRWWGAAAEQGLAEAQGKLGFLYGDGFGVSKDIVQGCKWTILAADQGNVLAKDYIQVFAYDATPEQITEAQRLAREFKPRKVPAPGAPVSGKGISDSNPEAAGSGFFVTENGFLVTNNHVVKDAAQIRLVTSRGFIVAQVVNVDAANDLALLKAEGQFAPLPVASSRAVHLGNSVATVGFPNVFMQGFMPKFARGEIASLAGASDDARYFQISVPLQPGNSGGPLVDEHGNVMGVVSAKLDASAALAASGELPENVNYAVKGSLLLNFLESVPEVSAKLKAPINSERKFDEVVQSAQAAAVLVLVY